MGTGSSISPDRLLAKSNPEIELRDHCRLVGNEAASILDSPAVGHVLDAPLINTGIDRERVQTLARYAGRMHDTGKAHPDWQQAVRADSRPPGHSGRGALYTFRHLQQAPDAPVDSRLEAMAVVLAVLHHHTPLTREHMNVQQRASEEVLGVDSETLTAMPRLLSDAGYGAVELEADAAEYLATELQAVRTGKGGYDTDTLGTLTTLIRSALIQADHYVSARHSGTELSVPEPLTLDALRLFDGLRPFQQRIEADMESPLLGLAGCGEGKTHSAVQWGKEMIERGRADRLVFAMPTRVTTNNLLLSLTGGDDGDRLAHVPPESAGLYHSAGSVFYDGEVAAERWDTSAEILSERARRWFQTPVTVTTVDHLLSTLVNGYDGATIARGNLLRSAIVFDELQAYDTQLVGHILGGIEQLSQLDIPWYVMTATLPPQIRTDRAMQPTTVVKSDGRLEADRPPREPFAFRLTDQRLTADEVDAAISNGDAGQRVMVVKNTVRKARQLALDLRDRGYDVTYYSSEFIRDHRRRKEADIRSEFGVGEYTGDTPRVLVSTQVCEISLDLSADIILTDVAPMDALVQRAGRLHRRGQTPSADTCGCDQCQSREAFEYECRVFAPLQHVDRWYPYADSTGTDDWQLLEQTVDVLRDAGVYRFDRSLRWVERAYAGIDGDYRKVPFKTAVSEDRLYGPHRRVAGDANTGRDDLQLRTIGNYRRDVFAERYVDPDGTVWAPAERWQAEHDCSKSTCGLHTDGVGDCTSDWQAFQYRFQVGVPRWWLSADDVPVGPTRRLTDDGGPIPGSEVVNVVYEYDTGVRPRK